MRGAQEPQETQGPKDGVGTPGPRAGLECSVSREKKVTAHTKGSSSQGGLSPFPGMCVLNILLVLKGPEVSKDSWEAQGPPGV